jgi:hypothetical protein
VSLNLAEELFVCGIDEKGNAPSMPAALGAGVAAELVLAGRIELDGQGVTLLDDSATGDPLLDGALPHLNEPFVAEMQPAAVLLMLGMEATPFVRQSVVDKGAVTAEKAKRRWLGLPSADLYRVMTLGQESRERLRAVLAGHTSPDERTAIVAAITFGSNVEVPASVRDLIAACKS